MQNIKLRLNNIKQEHEDNLNKIYMLSQSTLSKKLWIGQAKYTC